MLKNAYDEDEIQIGVCNFHFQLSNPEAVATVLDGKSFRMSQLRLPAMPVAQELAIQSQMRQK